MDINKKAAQAASAGTAKEKTAYRQNSTRLDDPLIGWYSLAKPARMRQQKKSRMRKQRGSIDAQLLANGALFLVLAALLLIGGAA